MFCNSVFVMSIRDRESQLTAIARVGRDVLSFTCFLEFFSHETWRKIESM